MAGQSRRWRRDELFGAQAHVSGSAAQPLRNSRIPASEWHTRGDRPQAGKQPGHFMPPSLLASQFDTLEPLEPDEGGVTIDVGQDIDSIVENYVRTTELEP